MIKNLIQYTFLTFCALTLSACGTFGNRDTSAPYSMEHTAEHVEKVAMPVEEKMCPAPEICESCTDVAPLNARIRELESQLAQCREASSRVKQTYRETLQK